MTYKLLIIIESTQNSYGGSTANPFNPHKVDRHSHIVEFESQNEADAAFHKISDCSLKYLTVVRLYV